MKNGKVYLVGATKGGVGKSVSSYNLAYSLAKLGKKVLAVDFDSQAKVLVLGLKMLLHCQLP